MDLTIKWSDKAELEFDQILTYWNNRNGSQLYSLKLIDLFNKSLEKLVKHPRSGQSTDKPSVRYKIVKDYFIYYKFNDTTLYIIDICDMRRDPDYIKSLLI